MDGLITSGYDVAELAVDAFVLFFIGLIFYLRREDRREGYPLESDSTGKLENHGVWMPIAKTFALADGRTMSKPDGARETRDFAMQRMAVWSGSPSVPTGDPLADGVGPASYALREEVPDRTFDGHIKIAPMASLHEFHVLEGDADPRGMAVVGCDGKTGGTVSDLWIDRSEALIRYLEVTVGDGGKILLPMPFAKVSRRLGQVKVRAIRADQFAGVPRTAAPDQATRREEDAICAYYAGGLLYATPERAEPLV